MEKVLTEFDIDAMPSGREMDAMVAEQVMGYFIYCRPAVGVNLWITDPSKKDLPIAQRWNETIEPICYSTDIAAAWMVVEKLMPLWHIEIDCMKDEGMGDFQVSFDDMARTYWGFANCAPLAICRAALKAVLK